MADNPASGGLSAKAAALLGLPENLKFYSPYPFSGMNQQDSPTAIDDKEFVYLENFVKLGTGQFRTLWDVGTPVYTAPTGKTIVWFKFFTLATTDYCAIFLSDGSVWQLNLSNSALTEIATTGFYVGATGYRPHARQWGSTYLLMANRNTTNDYWIWDGTSLYTSGTAAPQGVNLASIGFSYSSTPTVTTFGGSGSGMAFQVEVSDGGISEINITNPGSGYLPGDIVQLQFSGGGSDSSAVLQPYLSSGHVGGVSISAYGTGYTSAPTVAFSGGGGSGAAGTALVSVGVTSITGLVPGSGYTSAPTVAFSGGGGAGAAGYATILAGAVTGIVITTPGSGYTSAPTIAFSGGGGTGAGATAVVSSGVTGVNITSPGSGYTTAPSVAFSGGGGSGAIGVAVLAPSGLGGITVVNGGSGFTSVPTITVDGGGGSGAVAIAVLTPTSVAQINVTAGGANYIAAPTITFTGYPPGFAGTHVAATAVMLGGSVVGVTITNAGSGLTAALNVVFTNAGGDTTGAGAGATIKFNPTSIASVVLADIGQYYTSAPVAIVSAGANNAASATVNLMPFGVSGAAIETYLSRAWIVAPAVAPYETIPASIQWSFSAPESVSDFATSDGGGNEVSTDSFLQTTYTNVRQSSGYLYLFGDGSASMVSNVGTTGTPATTTYSYQNVDPQAGLQWRDSLQDFGRSCVVANMLGIYGLYGGAMTKVSAKIDQLLSSAPEGPAIYPGSGGVTPSSAVATIFNVKHYLNLTTLNDPETGVARNVMVAWNEKDWFIASQSISFTFIAEQKVGSNYVAWGTDGTKLYPMFQAPSATLQKRMWTKAYGADSFFVQKAAKFLWLQAQDKSVGLSGISGTVTSQISTIAALLDGAMPNLMSGEYTTVLQEPAFATPPGTWPIWGTSLGEIAFTTMSLKITTTSPDFLLGNLAIGYLNVQAYGG